MSWNRSITLYFLELLLKERRNNPLLSVKKTAFRELCKSLVKEMEAKFPDENWTVKKLENKHNYLRCFWRAFRDAAERPGTTYNPETKTLRMSDQNIHLIRSKYPRNGKAVTSQPLLTNEAIDYKEWLEIFSLETPAGQDLTKADTIKVGDANVVEASRHSCDTDWLKRCAHSMDNASSPLTSVEDGDHSGGIVVQQPRKRRRTLRATSQSSTPSPTLPATLLDDLQKGEPQQLAAFIALSKVIDGIARQGGKHNIIIQPVGAEDLEKACIDAQRLREEHGMTPVLRVLSWLLKDPRNAIIWNALVSNELKMAWIASDFGQNV
ncbi:hypothetical protein VCV18_003675 [Metarhizium anisopliae]